MSSAGSPTFGTHTLNRRDPASGKGRFHGEGVALFAMINEQGPSWVNGRPMREQEGWTEHARFMNAIADEGLVVLGGPIGKGARHRAMLILRATDENALRSRLEEDPWMRSGVLQMGELLPWELLLGELR